MGRWCAGAHPTRRLYHDLLALPDGRAAVVRLAAAVDFEAVVEMQRLRPAVAVDVDVQYGVAGRDVDGVAEDDPVGGGRGDTLKDRPAMSSVIVSGGE